LGQGQSAKLGLMRRELPGGYELDDDVERIDLDAVHRYLAEVSYWAEGRPRAVVEDLVRTAARVIGLYHGDQQVGFARIFSDGHTLSYLADVYVLEEHRGKGLGVELVREAVEGSPLAHTRWLLHTRDARSLYERFGFGPPSERLMERHTA
jgi:GNAT superfamily N-acetyltransferase